MQASALIGELERRGTMTESEAASHVAGRIIRGSWWADTAGKKIFAALSALMDHPDVLATKLCKGRRTFVHRRLWPALVRLQRERGLWREPSEVALVLLERVRREGEVQASGKERRELEEAMLVVAREVHTPTGRHAVALVAFEDWVPPDVAHAADAMGREEAQAALSTTTSSSRTRRR